ncbi:hypothetical protein DYQ86_14165 [Acidobacteria bacterium AB60]|nr:hypothetical protein DYQ86_14165 [Acidobacteria bacterium AB60]
MMRTLLCCLLLASVLPAQTRELDVQPASGWVDSGIDLQPGESFQVSATGQLQYPDARQANGPEGLPRAYKDLLRNFQLNDAGRGTLIGRIGENAAARPFSIGNHYSGKAWIAGRLFLAVNQTSTDEPSGTYHVKMEITALAATPAATRNVTVPAFTQSMIDSIPTRVSDPNGAPGDRVNFIIVGSQEQMQAAFKAAGWVTVDRSQGEAVVRGLLASLSKEAYVTLPMSELQLFGRSQDFGYAQADPLRVVASRHHFRIWKAPFELGGQTVWVGAGTHDIGFDRDQRNNGVTHKIDPNTDGERDYIRDSLLQTGMVIKSDYLAPSNPITKARTATGEEFSSDGRTLLIYLAAGSGSL